MFYIQAQVGISRYSAVYGSFAAIPFFLIWLRLSWTLVFVGAEIAFSLQHFRSLDYQSSSEDKISPSTQFTIAILILKEFIVAFENKKAPLSARALETKLGLPPEAITNTLSTLLETGLICHVDAPKQGYQLAQDSHQLTLHEVWHQLQSKGSNNIPTVVIDTKSLEKSLQQWFLQLEQADQNYFLRDL